MIIAGVVIALTIGTLLITTGVAFMIVATFSQSITGFGKTVYGTGRIFLWSGCGLLLSLILAMTLDISGVY